MTIQVQFKRLPHGEGIPLPAYQTDGAAGFDLVAAVDLPVPIPPGCRRMIPTGWAIAVPPGYEAQCRPRSGLAWKNGLQVLNTPGTIDSDYRGEISVILQNHDDHTFVVERGMRIAQIIVAPVVQAELVEVSELSDTARGIGGFGSTGV
jgi:dUTP pyrophosphatase